MGKYLHLSSKLFGEKKLLSLVTVMATILLLAACGGGSTSNGGGTTDTPASNTGNTENAVRSNADETTTRTLKDTAEVDPQFGSVSQIYGFPQGSAVEADRNVVGESYTLTLPTKSGSTISLDTVVDLNKNVEEETYDVSNRLPGGEIKYQALYKDNDDQATLADVYTLSTSDPDLWMVGGTWLYLAGLSGNEPTWEAGSFIDGPEISDDPDLPISGTAEYTGVATGNYAATAGRDLTGTDPGTVISGYYSADFEAMADFNSADRTLTGKITITESYGYDRFVGSTFSWEDITFGEDGQATGDVTVNILGLDLTENNGKIGNKFSTEGYSDTDNRPRLMAGTHSGSIESSGGTEAGFIGVHIGALVIE